MNSLITFGDLFFLFSGSMLCSRKRETPEGNEGFYILTSLFQDHPSLGQLSDKLLENNIYSVFAVEKQQYQWYEVISPTRAHNNIQYTCIYNNVHSDKILYITVQILQ